MPAARGGDRPQPTDAEVRQRGDATTDQRAALKRLLETKRYPKEWRDQFFEVVRAADGLSQTRARSTIGWLEQQPNLDGASPRATPDQIGQLLMLLKERVTPRPIAQQIRRRIAAGTLTVDQADLYLTDLQRQPLWRDIRPAVPDPTEGVTP